MKYDINKKKKMRNCYSWSYCRFIWGFVGNNDMCNHFLCHGLLISKRESLSVQAKAEAYYLFGLTLSKCLPL